MATVNEKMKAIADAIRAKTGESGKLSLSLMADKIPVVYSKGYTSGYNKGLEEGGSEGTSVQFWDNYQPTEVITNAHFMFAGKGWNDSTFTPKRSIRPIDARYMFNESGIVDLKGILERNNVELDLSYATNVNYLFYYARTEYLPIIDISHADGNTSVFDGCKVRVMDGLILPSTQKGELKYPFRYCYNLTTIKDIQGFFFKNVSFGQSTYLDKETIIRVINALSSTSQGCTATFAKSSIDREFRITTAYNGSTSAEWLALVATKPNWTITLN